MDLSEEWLCSNSMHVMWHHSRVGFSALLWWQYTNYCSENIVGNPCSNSAHNCSLFYKFIHMHPIDRKTYTMLRDTLGSTRLSCCQVCSYNITFLKWYTHSACPGRMAWRIKSFHRLLLSLYKWLDVTSHACNYGCTPPTSTHREEHFLMTCTVHWRGVG